jgi:hypothetical protein
MKTVCASARLQVISVILCCVGLQQIAQAQQFAPAVNYPTGINPGGVAVGDFNQDGIPDLVTANGAGTVSILLGNGDGTFRPSRDYGAGVGTSSVAVGDFNGDGKPDLVVANNGGFGVLLGNGDGTFQPVVEYNTVVPLGFVAVADFNGDGKLDLVVAGGPRFTGPFLGVFLGKGDGTFAPAAVTGQGFYALSVAVGDFNGDGRLDLAVTFAGITVLLGNGDGTFQAGVGSSIGEFQFAVGIASGDFNGDGKLDLVVGNDVGDGYGVLIGNGDGTFQAPVIDRTITPLADAVGDFNGDGKLDLFVPGALLLGNGDGTFRFDAAYPGGDSAVVAADLNSDGLLDVAATNFGSNTVSVLLNVGQSCRAAPEIDHVRARPDTLSPSGRLVDVFIDYHATSDCGGPPACILAVGSNEPLTQKDYRIIDAHHLKLRAEVSDREERKHSDQRVYNIQVSCTDRRSNVAHGHTIVTVREDHQEHHDEDHRKHHDLDPASAKEEDSGSTP